MGKIIVEKPDKNKLDALGVDAWPIWEKEVSKFDWNYPEKETCYILEGSAKVTCDDGEVAEFGAGDLVVFPPGLNCVWQIIEPIRKHYNMG